MMSRKTYHRGLLTLLLVLVCSVMGAQDRSLVEQDEMFYIEIQSRLLQFLDEWKSIASDIQYGPSDNLPDIQLRMQQLDAMWTTYCQAQQVDIASDETLLEIVGNIQAAKQTADEQFAKRDEEVQKLKNFKDAELYIGKMDSIYNRLSKMAGKMALVKQMTGRLEKLKAKEQIMFAEIQTHYDAAKEAAETIPTLQKRMKKLEEKYIVLKNASEKIQAAAYQPWITRIKDYLLGLAAISIMLMFLSMIMSKIKAAKQAREAAKKLQQMMPTNDQQYPTI